MAELSVPYKSQFDNDAGLAGGDCVECSFAMLASYLYGKPFRTDTIVKASGPNYSCTSVDAISETGKGLGIPLLVARGGTIEKSRKLIEQGKPHIAIVDYSRAMWREDNLFNGLHAVLIIGADKPQKVYVINDPYKKVPRNKGKQVVTGHIFEYPWERTDFLMLVPDWGGVFDR